MSAAPSAQFRPTASGRACAMLFQNASLVCPLSVRPLLSTMVPLMNTGSASPRSMNSCSTAKMAALAFSVSKMVSISSMSTPPSSSADTCAW